MEMTSTHINVLAGLSEDEVVQVTAACKEQAYGAGEAIFREGDAGEELFIVRAGRVRVSKSISLDLDRTLAIVPVGGVFGELAMVGEAGRATSAIATEPTTVLSLSREGFHRLTMETPVVGLKIMARFAAMLAQRLRVTTDLLRETVQWGLEVSGAASLNLQRLIHTNTLVTLSLSNGVALTGQLLKVEHDEAGSTLLVRDEEHHLNLIPYHAVSALRFAHDLLAASESA